MAPRKKCVPRENPEKIGLGKGTKKRRQTQQGKRRNKEVVFSSIKPFLQLGYSVRKSCDLAGIPRSTVAYWLSKNPELQPKVTSWQNMACTAARRNLIKSITQGENQDTSKWWLERKEKQDFSTRQEVDVRDKTLEEALDDLDDDE